MNRTFPVKENLAEKYTWVKLWFSFDETLICLSFYLGENNMIIVKRCYVFFLPFLTTDWYVLFFSHLSFYTFYLQMDNDGTTIIDGWQQNSKAH